MKTSTKGINLIKKYESCYLKAYLCPAKIPTIGFGHTNGVKLGMSITKVRAEELLKQDLEYFETSISALVKVPLTQNQFDALVSFVFNIGVNAFRKSTILRLINLKQYASASLEFIRWNKAAGKELLGLTRRRKEELQLFIG
jgi:lysozyme